MPNNLLITHIKELWGTYENASLPISGLQMKSWPKISNAWLWIEKGEIKKWGTMEDLAQMTFGKEPETWNAEGRMVLPAFVDAHTHLIYAKSREEEFVDRINGLSYQEIAAKGGGILNSAKVLQQTSEQELFESAIKRLEGFIALGTGAIEIKSGYGLTLADELKMLRVARRIKESSPIPIKTTFLGAHAFPTNMNREEYVDEIIQQMIPLVADEGLADYCDVFCETGFFTPEETEKILNQGLKYGLKPKVHANELDFSGGVQVGTKVGATSVDHLECCGEAEIEALQNSKTIPVLLPGTAFFLGLNPPPARKLLEANLPVALSSDFNPGTCPSGNMPQVVSLASILLKMTPEEAFIAATQNAAAAIDLQTQLGSITKGKKSNIIITKKVPGLSYLPYSFGENWVERVVLG